MMEIEWIIVALLFIIVMYFVSGLHTVFYTKYVLNRDYKKGVFNFLHESNAVVRPIVNNIFEKIFGNKYHYRIKYIYSGNNRIIKEIKIKVLHKFSYYKKLKAKVYVFFMNEILKRR